MDKAALKDFRQRVVGRRETVKHIQRGTAETVFVARDANPKIVAEIEALCREHQVTCEYVDTMRELGELCGIEVDSATAARIRRE